ncbi:MAG TPA: leucyl/phenylalanyl-tRNA--protein transferase [Caulobacterales bacterium]|nr:leucyl/phenylalanyl-tRNA--protein transferase [Caulobacterales bacterium]
MVLPFGPAELLDCYRRGVFPMAEAREDRRLFLIDPEKRGVLPLEGFHVPHRLARTIRSERYVVTVDRDFPAVLRACAAVFPGREDTWINDPIIDLYERLHKMGFAHSIECRRDGDLVGGLYGVSLGAAFFGESMFSRARDASKVALVHLVARLTVGGYTLLDSQFWTPHLGQFGAIEMDRAEFKRRLDDALKQPADFARLPSGLAGAQLLQSITQTS